MKKKIFDSGIWLQPIMFVGAIVFLYNQNRYMLSSRENILLLFLGSFLPTCYILITKKGTPREQDAIMGKEKAMYPPVQKQMLYKEPTGIVLGKYKGKYVCRDINADGHVFLIGGSGSGKSSCYVIPSLLVNSTTRIFAIDIKGELSYKSAKCADEHVLIFNPQDRSKYGYNPFFNLDEKNSSQKILEVMQTIVYSLIPMPAGLKDPFWKNSARNLLLGLLIYYYKCGVVDFVSIIDAILGQPVRVSINDVMQKANKKSAEYRYINQFSAMEDETLGGIVAEMNNHIVIFANDQDIRYAFRDNGCKINPHLLEEGYSIYLSIREEKLSAYYDVMQLIINQTLAELEKRPEDAEPVLFIIDELPRILSAGKIDRLLDGARTLRSRHVVLFLITQSTEALMSAFTENEVNDLISNCPYIIVLSASSPKTQKSVCSWCGKYKAKKQSWSGTGKDRKVSVSFEEKDIVEPSELMTLANSGEAILISPWGYNRVTKVPYYEDRVLKPMADKIIKYNKLISKI